MLCEICKKEKANVHFTQIVNGEITEMHLCESCAEEKGIDEISFFSSFALADLLSGLTDLEIVSTKEKVKCKNCGLSYHDFNRTGRLGCSECYKIFHANLLPLLKRIHGKTEHIGKTPSKLSIKMNFKKELLSLQRELQEAIVREEYEKAALIRDKIRALKKENGN